MRRAASAGLCLVMAACGGESTRATHGERNAHEDSGLSGDYWIATPDQSYFVTVVSPTQALVGPAYSSPTMGYSIEHHPGATLAWETISERPGIQITGEYVLRSTVENDLAGTTYAFDLETNSALVANGEWYCHGSNPMWTVAEGSAVEDTTPTEVKAIGDGVVVEPWGYVGFLSERPIEAPLTTALELKVDGSPVSIAWGDAPSGLASVLSGPIADWPSLLGRTLELSGFVTASNGAPSPVLATVQVLDYGRHTSLVDFRSSLPADVTAWGVTYAGPGVSACPDGCASFGPGSGMGLRFQNPGPLLRVTSTFNGLGMTLMSAGGTPTYVSLPQGDGSTLTTADIAVPAISGDLFVLIRGPSSPEGLPCQQTTPPSAFLASVESTAG